MADDRRADAMRQAIEEADAENKKPKAKASSKKDSGGIVDKVSGTVDKVAGMAVPKIKDLWKTKYGKIGMIGGVAFVLILLVLCVVAGSSSGSKAVTADISYEVSDAILCVYESENVSSGYAFDAYVEVTNTGTSNIYLKDAQFLVQDSSGNRIMIDSNLSTFPAVIQPGEKGYIYNKFGTELTGVTDPDATYQLVPAFAVMQSSVTPASYEVSNISITDGTDGKVMTASVTNMTSELASSMYVVGVTYNADGHMTSISGTFVSNVESGVSVSVKFDPLNTIRAWKTEPVTDYVVYAY